MFAKRLSKIGLVAVAGLGLSACVYDDYGYGGVSVGYGGGGYYDDYYPGYYGYPSYGWYDGFYYPGSGYYVYDRGGHRHRWNDGQRRYWEQRRHHAGRPGGPGRPGRPGDDHWQGRPDRPDRPGNGWAGRPDRPDRPDREDWRKRREAARGEGVWGAVPRENRPQMSRQPNAGRPQQAMPRPSSPPRAMSRPTAPAPRATPPGGRAGQAIRESRGREGRNFNARPD